MHCETNQNNGIQQFKTKRARSKQNDIKRNKKTEKERERERVRKKFVLIFCNSNSQRKLTWENIIERH